MARSYNDTPAAAGRARGTPCTVTCTPQNHHGSRFVDMSVLGPNGRYIW